MELDNRKPMGPWRSRFFPIYGDELKKFLPLSLIFFCIGFNYTVLRGLKDYFILQGAGGAESISALKLFGVMPAVIIFTMVYNTISKSLDRDGRFNFIIIYLVGFFILFVALLFPNREALMLNDFADNLIVKLPQFKSVWQAIRVWPLSLFYIHAEMWGTFGLSVAFWTFTNAITNIKQSKRFYSFLNIASNIAMIASGQAMSSILLGKPGLQVIVIISFGVILLVVYNIFSRRIQANPVAYQIEEKPKKKKAKVKLSLLESFKFLFTSQYLMLIAVIVLGYNMSINLSEAVWKDAIKAYSSLAEDGGVLINKIYALQYKSIGTLAILLIFFFSTPIMNRGWKVAALFTPVLAIIFGGLFFAFMIFGDKLNFIAEQFGTTTLALGVWLGLANVVCVKAFKYIFFDPTKEQLYIPLDEESKVRGKAAVDGAGGRLGKSLGALLIVFMFVPIFGNISASKPYIAVITMFILVAWAMAVGKLSVLFEKRLAEKEKEKDEDNE